MSRARALAALGVAIVVALAANLLTLGLAEASPAADRVFKDARHFAASAKSIVYTADLRVSLPFPGGTGDLVYTRHVTGEDRFRGPRHAIITQGSNVSELLAAPGVSGLLARGGPGPEAEQALPWRRFSGLVPFEQRVLSAALGRTPDTTTLAAEVAADELAGAETARAMIAAATGVHRHGAHAHRLDIGVPASAFYVQTVAPVADVAVTLTVASDGRPSALDVSLHLGAAQVTASYRFVSWNATVDVAAPPADTIVPG